MFNEKPEEAKVTDPTVAMEPDLRLTMREWVLYWKVKYEQMLVRFQEIADLLMKQKQMMQEQTKHIAKLNDRCNELEGRCHDMQAERQAAIANQGTDITNPLPTADAPVAKPKRKRPVDD